MRAQLTGMDLQTASIIRNSLGEKVGGQLVAVDNYFMSPRLCSWADEVGIYLVGTLRAGKVSGELFHTLSSLNRRQPGPRTAAVSSAPAGAAKKCSIDVSP